MLFLVTNFSRALVIDLMPFRRDPFLAFRQTPTTLPSRQTTAQKLPKLGLAVTMAVEAHLAM